MKRIGAAVLILMLVVSAKGQSTSSPAAADAAQRYVTLMNELSQSLPSQSVPATPAERIKMIDAWKAQNLSQLEALAAVRKQLALESTTPVSAATPPPPRNALLGTIVDTDAQIAAALRTANTGTLSPAERVRVIDAFLLQNRGLLEEQQQKHAQLRAQERSALPASTVSGSTASSSDLNQVRMDKLTRELQQLDQSLRGLSATQRIVAVSSTRKIREQLINELNELRRTPAVTSGSGAASANP